MKNKAKEVKLNFKKRGLIKVIFSRTFLFTVLFLLQIFLLVLFAINFTRYYVYYYWVDFILRITALIVMIFRKSDTPYKVSWLLIMVVFPIIGPGVYLAICLDWFPARIRRLNRRQIEEIKSLQTFDMSINKDLEKVDSRYAGIANYLAKSASFPIFKNNPLTYYESGEASLRYLIHDLKNAKKFIFLEFFIVKNGSLLQELLSILKAKAKEGVEIKFLYDGFNAMLSMPFNYPKRLKQVGIEAKVFFQQKTPFFHRESYRSHRKSIIIDGKIAYVGGVNLADEYVNRITRFGYWKDAMLRIEGESVNSITLTFLGMWDYEASKPLDKSSYLIDGHQLEPTHNFVIPYCDYPLDDESIGVNVYLEMINKATDYIYFSSPYLVVESEFLKALSYAAKRGVEVVILLPSIPDKKIVNFVAKSYYKTLIKSGIKIYEYTPGFNHVKICVSDDVVFSLGSINLDYRSFYLSFENSVFAYDPHTAIIIKKDLIKAFKKSTLIDEAHVKKMKPHILFLGYIFRLFAPLF